MFLLLLLSLFSIVANGDNQQELSPGLPFITLPISPINANNLAVIVNDSDSLSVQIGRYYQKKRHIPEENILHVSFVPGRSTMSPRHFAKLIQAVEAKIPVNIQAFLLTWAAPYRVGCMSISSAFTFGFDAKYCASGCKPTYLSRYAGSVSRQPFDHYGIRPTMLLAATNLADAKALIDRGVSADGLFPDGAAYLITTADKTRNGRNIVYPLIENQLINTLQIYNKHSSGIKDKHNVLFYFTGDTFVKNLNTNTYLPGAITDHLTSAGGKLTDSQQMSAIDWLRAGATGSYGTVVEPCNILEKFPNPLVVIKKYLKGETLIEAYWKSVKMPGQGVFIGEPLAKPYGGYQLKRLENALLLSSPELSSGHYNVFVSNQVDGPYKRLLSSVEITVFNKAIRLPKPYYDFYKIEKLQQYGQPPIEHFIPY